VRESGQAEREGRTLVALPDLCHLVLARRLLERLAHLHDGHEQLGIRDWVGLADRHIVQGELRASEGAEEEEEEEEETSRWSARRSRDLRALGKADARGILLARARSREPCTRR